MVCADTNLLIGLLRGNEDAKNAVAELEGSNEPIAVTAITAYELWKAACASSNPERSRATLGAALSSLRILQLTEEASRMAGETFEALRRKGLTIGEFDLLIAATAASNGETLITRDKDFERIPNLTVREW